MKIVSQCREQARWAYNDAVFEVKREIPDNNLIRRGRFRLSLRIP